MVEPLKLALRLAGIIGGVFFAGLFGLTFGLSDSVEKSAQDFIKYQVEREVREKYGDIANSTYGKALGRLKATYETEARQLQAAIKDNLPARIASVIAAMCRLDCTQRQSVQQSVESGFKMRLAATGTAVDTLTELIKGKYLEILDNLKRDVRIFLGTNAVLFLLVAVLAFVKPRAAVQLYLPAAVLIFSTLVCAAIYLFGQNWLFTIIYNDYVGFGYVAYVGALFAFLCDIAFNKARVTTEILNWIFQAVGSVAQAVPC